MNGGLMTHIITQPCIGMKDAACVETCPANCIHTTPEAPQYYIDPSECIDCGACIPVCPVQAIYLSGDEPEDQSAYEAVNADFFA